MNIQQFYSDANVRSRIIEFLGGQALENATCMFLTQCDTPTIQLGSDLRMKDDIDYFLTNGYDLSRSLWDEESLVAHLDVEYVNYDFPAEPYLDPIRTYSIQQPAALAIERILIENGISALHTLSGRGHHFTWKISKRSAAYGKLTKLGRLPIHLKQRYATPHPPINRAIESDLGVAYAGLGLVMDYIAYRVLDNAKCEIPVLISAVEVPPQKRGREMISIDITEYGDLLHTRVIRVPFTLYLKPWQRTGVLHDKIRDKVPPIVSIPLHEMDIVQGIEVMRNLDKAAELASRCSTQIPDQSQQMIGLINDYESSEISLFHDWFYSEEHEVPDLWPSTYDAIPMELLPKCTQHILNNPNDLLLKPSGMRQVVRVLLALGWHPRHIAGLIRSKFERDYGWGREWYFYDAGMRADFYTRVFSGLVKTKRDNFLDFDCVPVEKSQYCFDDTKSCVLDKYKKSLEERVKYERLASRPFNGLFLPDKHF